ncbi:MAG TPA: hypothetical protein VH479_00015 [Acidimicrobiales bacterium]
MVAGLLAVVAAISMGVTSAAASPPTHEKVVEKDVAVTIPPLAECPAGDATSIDLVFHDVLHQIFTDTSFHFTEVQTGTFVTRSASGAALNSGHFTSTFSFQGPREPTQTFTNNINAEGRASDGTHVRIKIIEHGTANANGDVTVDFMRASCD